MPDSTKEIMYLKTLSHFLHPPIRTSVLFEKQLESTTPFINLAKHYPFVCPDNETRNILK